MACVVACAVDGKVAAGSGNIVAVVVVVVVAAGAAAAADCQSANGPEEVTAAVYNYYCSEESGAYAPAVRSPPTWLQYHSPP